MPSASPSVAPSAAHGASNVFIVITVVEMDMCMSFAIWRRKLRRLKLTVLHRILMVLVLEDLR
jgi:hypothetical protein